MIIGQLIALKYCAVSLCRTESGFLCSAYLSQRKQEHHAADSLYPLQEEPSHDKSSHVEIPHYRTHGTSPIPKSNTAQQLAASTPVPHQHSTVSPKRKLILSTSEKERLLNWDLSTPGTYSSTAAAIDKAERYSARPGNSQKPQTVPEPQPEPGPAPAEPEPSPPPSGFQMWASVLRRSFSGAANNPKVIRRNRPRRARPLSEGSFGFNFLFSGSAQNQEEGMMKRPRADRSGSRSETEGRSEITAMLEQVTLSNKPSGASKDDMASLPPRKLNFFSSMRLKRNEGGNGSKTDHQAKDIWNILSKFRNNGATKE